ncbi:hypothetical protein [Acidianus brierleyi]|nr:hypothetical protein [Acidianus brierleyi]
MSINILESKREKRLNELRAILPQENIESLIKCSIGLCGWG